MSQSTPVSADLPIIAVVGMSNRPNRASYGVAAYMQSRGYRNIPVNPVYAGEVILGELCHPTLRAAADALNAEGKKIAIVDCFRKSADIPPVVDDAIAIGATCVWMQLDIVHEEAAAKARAAGLKVIMDKCIKIEHAMGQMHGVL